MDDQKFDMLMSTISKIDNTVEKLDDRLREVEINQGIQNTEIKAMHYKFDSQFPKIQSNLDAHIEEDIEHFDNFNKKISPLESFQTQFKKEIWYHRAGLAVLFLAAAMSTPESLSAAITALVNVFKNIK